MDFAEFISAHSQDDPASLALARERYAPELSWERYASGETSLFDLALSTLEVRRKLRLKVPSWYAVPSLVFPLRLSGEQCSSEATARYKASVALKAVASTGTCRVTLHAPSVTREVPEDVAGNAEGAKRNPPRPFRIADLTGGLGVDSWAFAQVFGLVLYNEMQPSLAAAAEWNFSQLGLGNVVVKCFECLPEESLVSSGEPDSAGVVGAADAAGVVGTADSAGTFSGRSEAADSAGTCSGRSGAADAAGTCSGRCGAADSAGVVGTADAAGTCSGRSGAADAAGTCSGRQSAGRPVREILEGFSPDILYLDPARRAADGRKVFRLEDCRPDVLQLLPELLAACPLLLLKLSPMADISLVCKQLGCVSQVHVVAAEGECKELLLLLEKDYSGPYAITVFEDGAVLPLLDQIQGKSEDGAVLPLLDQVQGKSEDGAVLPLLDQVQGKSGPGSTECAGPGPGSVEQDPLGGIGAGPGPGDGIGPGPKTGWTRSRPPGEKPRLESGETGLSATSGRRDHGQELCLFEPGKGLLKAGAFDLPCAYGLEKLGRHTHLYIGPVPEVLKPFGKTYEILETLPLNKRSIKDIAARYPRADVTARNLPLTSEELRKKLGVKDGGPIHIFGTKAVADNVLIICRVAQ